MELKKRGLNAEGKKAVLLERLAAAIEKDAVEAVMEPEPIPTKMSEAQIAANLDYEDRVSKILEMTGPALMVKS